MSINMVFQPTFCNMGRHFLCAAAASLVLFAPVHAAEPARDLDFKGLYKCTMSGINFAKIGVHAEQDAHAYAMTADIMSTGIVNMFTKHSSHTTVDASGSNYTYSHINYETDYKTKNKKRYVNLIFADGKFKEEKLEPPENPAKRPPVPLEQKQQAQDPLSALLQARQELFHALQSGAREFTIDVYDGRRLTKVDFTVVGDKVLKLSGAKVPVVEVTARRTFLAGFTRSEIADKDANEPALHIYFSNDEKLFPVRLQVQLFFGLMTADLIKACSGSESCLLGNKE